MIFVNFQKMIAKNELLSNINIEAIFNKLPIAVFICNKRHQIIAVNKVFCDLFTANEKEIVGKHIKHFIRNRDKEKSSSKNTDKQVISLINKHDLNYEATILPVDTGIENDKMFLGIIANADNRDQWPIDEKESHDDKQEKENELSDMKSRFLSIASHEFRTPLAGILSSLNLINRYLEADKEFWERFKTREKVEKHLDKINESVKNLTTILQKFLALGNIEKGEIPVKPTRFNLKKTIALQTTQFQQICKPNQKIIYVNRNRKATVFLDKHLLKNIMNNLLSNAIKFSPENSEIQVFTEIDKDKTTITVKDFGIGIPNSERSKIFRRFYRARNTLTYEEGTGLGLNIVKKYVELMKGSIDVKSEINKGTTFKITFPIQKV